MDNNLEEYFLTHAVGVNILTIGSINSGKTFLALHFIYYALEHGLFDQYHLILPQFSSEQNDSYSFLKKYKSNVFVYKEYDDVIVDHIKNLKDKYTIYFMIDDATGQLDMHGDQGPLVKLMSTCRHGSSVTTHLIGHASKVAAKPIRNISTFVFTTNINSEKMFKDIYEDFASMSYLFQGKNFKSYLADYHQMINTHEYPQMLICRKPNGRIALDFHVGNWKFLQVDLKSVGGKAPEKNQQKDEKKDEKKEPVKQGPMFVPRVPKKETKYVFDFSGVKFGR